MCNVVFSGELAELKDSDSDLLLESGYSSAAVPLLHLVKQLLR